jgi:3-oxoacyl-[acyl-carrier protein] reductase
LRQIYQHKGATTVDLQLTQKRVLVTGSTGGIGAGIARRFAGEGASVIINGRRSEQADMVAQAIRDAGGRAVTATGDLTVDDDVNRIVQTAIDELGGIDILVNNAAGGNHENDLTMPPADWLAAYDVNVLSMVRLIQRLLPAMQTQGWGRIINISSAAGMQPSPGMGAYSATKAAINNLTVTMARSVSNAGVTVNAVSPGAIITPEMITMGLEQGMGQSAGEVALAFDQMMGDTTPFKRMGQVDEIANVVVFLASPLASYIHGANIRVDGGYVGTVGS